MSKEQLIEQYNQYQGVIKCTVEGRLLLLSNGVEYDIPSEIADVHLAEGTNILHRVIDQHYSDDNVCETIANILNHYSDVVEINYTHTNYSWTPIMSAMQKNFVHTVGCLLEHYATIPTKKELLNNFSLNEQDLSVFLQKFGIDDDNLELIGQETFNL